MRTLETSLSRLNPIRFWAGQEEENEFREPGDYLKHRFLEVTKVEFWAFKRQKMTFKCHSNS